MGPSSHIQPRMSFLDIVSILLKTPHFANKACHQHLGSIHSPLLNIELTMVVDELHLLLRVTDVLIQNLISLAAT